MDSVLNISEGEMGIVHYFLALTMSLMYLIAGPSTDSSFSRQSWHSRQQGERHTERREERAVVVVVVVVRVGWVEGGGGREGENTETGEKIGLRISIAYS